MLTRYNIYIFLESKLFVATSMQKISTVALSVQKLGWGVIFTPPPPPPIRLAYIKKPIPNRVKLVIYLPLRLGIGKHDTITKYFIKQIIYLLGNNLIFFKSYFLHISHIFDSFYMVVKFQSY